MSCLILYDQKFQKLNNHDDSRGIAFIPDFKGLASATYRHLLQIFGKQTHECFLSLYQKLLSPVDVSILKLGVSALHPATLPSFFFFFCINLVQVFPDLYFQLFIYLFFVSVLGVFLVNRIQFLLPSKSVCLTNPLNSHFCGICHVGLFFPSFCVIFICQFLFPVPLFLLGFLLLLFLKNMGILFSVTFYLSEPWLFFSVIKQGYVTTIESSCVLSTEPGTQ